MISAEEIVATTAASTTNLIALIGNVYMCFCYYHCKFKFIDTAGWTLLFGLGDLAVCLILFPLQLVQDLQLVTLTSFHCKLWFIFTIFLGVCTAFTLLLMSTTVSQLIDSNEHQKSHLYYSASVILTGLGISLFPLLLEFTGIEILSKVNVSATQCTFSINYHIMSPIIFGGVIFPLLSAWIIAYCFLGPCKNQESLRCLNSMSNSKQNDKDLTRFNKQYVNLY